MLHGVSGCQEAARAPRESEPMANLPIEHTITLNNVSTGEVDFLGYAGTTLQDSWLSQVTGTVGWELVASAPSGEDGWSLDWLSDPGDAVGTLVFQNQSTGWVSLVAIDENFDVLGSHIVSYAGETDPAFLPRIEGEGFFGEGVEGSFGPQLVAQFEVDAFSSPFSGAIDLIGLDEDGNIIQTQVVEGTT